MFYFITDTHLGHDQIIGYCNRPADFSERIIKNWKGQVKPDDWVVHLGDVAWPKYYEVLKELPGHKILVRGNHDRKSDSWYRSHGFDIVCTEFANKIEGVDIVFTHIPLIFHDHDINVCGHLHASAVVDCPTCAHYVMALETTGYKVMSQNVLMKHVHAVLKEKTEA